MKAGFLLALIAVTIMVSGCTGADDGKKPEIKNNEIVIIENVEAVPSEVKPERNFIISGFVTNKAATKINNVQIGLADYCSSVFDVVKTSCSLESFDGYTACRLSLNL